MRKCDHEAKGEQARRSTFNGSSNKLNKSRLRKATLPDVPNLESNKSSRRTLLETRIPLHSSQLSVQLRSIVESSVPKASLGSDCRHIQSFKGSEGTRPSPVKGTTFNSDASSGESIALLKTQAHVLSLFHTCLSCVPPLNKSVIAHT